MGQFKDTMGQLQDPGISGDVYNPFIHSLQTLHI